MKAITILQPFPTLVRYGFKGIETRGWATKYRGKLAIHAGVGGKYDYLQTESPFYECLKEIWYLEHEKDKNRSVIDIMPRGAVIAIADLVDCVKIVKCDIENKIAMACNDEFVIKRAIAITGNEYMFGDYTPGRYAWILDNVQAIEPIAAKGQQRLWNWDIPDDYFLENFFMGGNKNE